jgi:hypothetical protein
MAKTFSALLGCAAVVAASAAWAHHSFASFDMNQHLKITGTVRTFEWTNPHAWLWVDVANDKGGVDTWGFEGSAPGEMSRNGWSKRAVNPGDKVTVEYRPLKSGQHGGSFGRVTLADGRVLGGNGLGGPPGAPGGPPGPGGPGGAPPPPGAGPGPPPGS